MHVQGSNGPSKDAQATNPIAGKCGEVRPPHNKHLIAEGTLAIHKIPSVTLTDKKWVKEYLEQKVTYGRQHVKAACPAGFSMETTLEEKELSRKNLFMVVFKWFVNDVMGKKHITELVDCMNAILDCSEDELLKMYCAYIFSRKEGDLVGIYAQDREADTLARFILKSLPMDKEDLLGHIKSDVGKGFSGLTRSQAWLYAGLGDAGEHIEDAWLHFINWLVDLVLEHLNDLEKAIMECARKLSTRFWLFCLKSTIPEHIDLLQQRMHEAIGLGHVYWEKCLHDRKYVLNPEWWLEQYPEDFRLVTQRPGDCISSNLSHSVCGFSMMSVAFNTCLQSHLLHYITCEYMAAAAASRRLAPGGASLRGLALSFCLTQELAHVVHTAGTSTKACSQFKDAVKMATLEYDRDMAMTQEAMCEFPRMGVIEEDMLWTKDCMTYHTPYCAMCASPLVTYAVHGKLTQEAIEVFKVEVTDKFDGDVVLCGRCAIAHKHWYRSEEASIVSIYSSYCRYWKL